jgi:DinB superfamily
MNMPWSTVIWQQFGAGIDMLDNALRACPDERWRDSLWTDSTVAPEYSQFWFIVFHTLKWLDIYLSVTEQGYALPAPFIAGSLPAQPYNREQLQAYLLYCRQKCRSTFETLTDEKASQNCKLPSGEEVSFVELQLYSMRHVQEHVGQLNLHLGQKVGSAPDWVSRAGSRDV